MVCEFDGDTIVAAWENMVGRLAAESRPDSIRDGRLIVVARHSCVVQELHFQKRKILAGMAALFPDSPIKTVRFQVVGAGELK